MPWRFFGVFVCFKYNNLSVPADYCYPYPLWVPEYFVSLQVITFLTNTYSL